jgi:hypothetical protein
VAKIEIQVAFARHTDFLPALGSGRRSPEVLVSARGREFGISPLTIFHLRFFCQLADSDSGGGFSGVSSINSGNQFAPSILNPIELAVSNIDLVGRDFHGSISAGDLPPAQRFEGFGHQEECTIQKSANARS